jgi:hypothetical protein
VRGRSKCWRRWHSLLKTKQKTFLSICLSSDFVFWYSETCE